MMNTFSGKWTWSFIFCALVLLIPQVSPAQQWIQVNPDDIPTLQNLTAVWTTSSITPPPEDFITTEIFCTGENATIIYFDGSSWVSQNFGGSNLNTIWGSSPDNVFAAGDNGTILHYDGSTWTPQNPGGNNLNSIWGSSPDNVFAVGDAGTIFQYVDSTWEQQTSGVINNLNAIWGSSASDVFVVGDQLTILHYDGADWELQTNPQNISLNGIWGTSSDNVFAVGESGTILWYSGGIWSSLSSGTSNELKGVWGASACNVYAVGRQGAILSFDGISWSSQTSASNVSINGISGSSMRDIHAAGNGPTLIDFDPEGDIYPMVCATSPADGTTDVALETSVRAFFSTEMDPDTIDAGTFTVSDGSSLVTGTVTYESGGMAVFTPDNDLDYATAYTAALSPAVKDPFRFGIESEYTWTFTTIDEGSSGSGGSGGCFISAALRRN
jgi:hypothetical protein